MTLRKTTYLSRKHFRITFGCLVVVSMFITYWLLTAKDSNVHITKSLDDVQKPKKQINKYSNALTEHQFNFHMRQNGNYWIIYNYIKALKEFKRNESITLVSHGEWTTIFNFTDTLRRWSGPISLTLFSSGPDFQRTRDILSFIKYCSIYGQDFDFRVTLNLIIHRSFVPKFIPRTVEQFYENPFNCTEYRFDFSNNFRIKQNLKYPSNLARNVGRLTAATDYVFVVDTEFIPSLKIPEKFLGTIKSLHVSNRKKTVFVLPSFDIKFGIKLPKYKSELFDVDQSYIEEYLTSTCIYKVPSLHEWLRTPNSSALLEADTSKRIGSWWGFYISLNMYEPFYDETYDKESKLDISNHMDLLEFLGYDFLILNEVFLVRHISPSYNYKEDLPSINFSQQLVENQRSVCAYKDILKNFID